MDIDRQLFIWINERLHTSWLDWLMPKLTNLHLFLWFWLVVGPLILWWWRKGGKQARTVIVLLAVLLPCVNFFSSLVAKPIFKRPRPTAVLFVKGKPETVVAGARLPPHSKPLGTSSFPSSHSAVTAAFATVMILAYRQRTRWAWLALLVPLVIGYSRIYVGVHYPSDVLGGWALGGLLAALAWKAVARYSWLVVREKPVARGS